MQKPIKYYKGVIVPMVTPFLDNGLIDKTSAGKLVNFLIENDTVPFILGTTGECMSIPVVQRDVLVDILIRNKHEKAPLITGVNGLTFADTVAEANKYLEWGIDAVVVTLPSYYSLTDRQIFHYFNDLSRQIKGDVILYNIPKTVNMSIPLNVVEELSNTKNIIGIKDSELNETRLTRSLKMWGKRLDFFHFVGVNKLMIMGLKLGAQGIIPSSANIEPQIYTRLYAQCTSGQHKKAKESFLRTEKLGAIYQKGKLLGESLAALKCILAAKDLCRPFVLRPLTPMNKTDFDKIKKEYSNYLNVG